MTAAAAAAAFNLLLYFFWFSLLFLTGSLQLCIEKERKALRSVRSGFPDVDRRLSPWKGDECCRWEGVGCNNVTGHVIKLDLSFSYILQSGIVFNRSEVHPSLFHLKHLEYLDMSFNNLYGHQIPSSVGSLTQLQHLDLSQCGFQGKIPASFVHLNNLQFLDLSRNSICGEIPETIGNLRNLRGLFLYGNLIEGVIPKSIGNLSKMSDLDLSDNRIVRGLPDSIGNLTALQNLDFSHNQIDGKIPDSIGNLLQLEHLDISENIISGLIPYTLGSLCNLSGIYLSDNSITGTVVEFFEQLSRCKSNEHLSIHLQNNQLIGSIPTSLGKWSALECLVISSNYLVGDITEAHLANLTNLISMDISKNNLSVKVSQDWLPPFQASEIIMRSCNLGPKFPSWLQNQTSLYKLDISNSGISGVFPDWFWSLCLSNMVLDVSSNHMRGMLPSSLECFKNVSVFDLSYNNFEGSIPRMTTLLVYLDLSHNSFLGQIPKSIWSEVDGISYMFLSNNKLNGSIPSSFCTQRKLQIMNLANNDLSGTLLDCWNNASSLAIIDVSNNKLSGGIPRTFGLIAKLQSLHINNNSFSDTIPSTLQNCNELVVIDLSWNKLFGAIPSWFGRTLSSLRVLSLRSNNFTGVIPSELFLIPTLQVLDLAHNNFSGSLPPHFGMLSFMITSQNKKEFAPLRVGSLFCIETIIITAKDLELPFTTLLSIVTSIDLSNNNLSGDIPKEITNLHGLRFLNLSMNHFSGNIPDKIGLMSQLESLDLSNNNLLGRIPSSISALNFLGTLNLSYNNLFGKIPTGNQLQTFTNLSYIGNPELCGGATPA